LHARESQLSGTSKMNLVPRRKELVSSPVPTGGRGLDVCGINERDQRIAKNQSPSPEKKGSGSKKGGDEEQKRKGKC